MQLPFSDKSDKKVVSKEVRQGRFKNLAKQYFQDIVKNNLEFSDYVKICSQIQAFSVPNEYKEVFVRYGDAAYLMICDHSVVSQFEEKAKSALDSKMSHLDNFRQIKDYFYKWMMTRNDEERKLYAFSVINFSEKNTNNENFLKKIYEAIVYSYDRKLYMPQKSLELYDEAYSVVDSSTMDFSLKEEAFYLINIYRGFTFLKMEDYEEASKKFLDALTFKTNGITAKFYLALCQVKQNLYQNSINLLNEILHFDLDRLEYALDNNNLAFFSFAISNAYLYSVFAEPEFFYIYEEIESMLNNNLSSLTSSYDKIHYKINKINSCGVNEYIDSQSKRNIDFIAQIHALFSENRNAYVILSLTFLEKKFMSVIENIIAAITKKYEDMMNEQLSTYDNQSRDSEDRIRVFKGELEEYKNRLKEKFDLGIKLIDKNINDNILLIEKRIENLHLEKKFDPGTTFNNAMVYDFIVSLFVFILGGFSGCYLNSSGSGDETRSLVTIIMISGLKWGALTFIIGIIVSAVVASYTVVDRGNEKQKLLKKVASIKNRKEREIEILKKEYENRVKAYTDEYGERINDQEKRIDKLKDDKSKEIDFFKQEAQRKINEQIDKFREIINL